MHFVYIIGDKTIRFYSTNIQLHMFEFSTIDRASATMLFESKDSIERRLKCTELGVKLVGKTTQGEGSQMTATTPTK